MTLRRHKPLNPGTPLRRSGFTPAQRATSLTRTAMKSKRPKVTPEERTARKLLAARSLGICELHGGHRATEAHHRKNRSQGGGWNVSNLMHLCHDGHMHVTVNPGAAREQGWSVPSHRDPASVPCWLAGRGYCFLTPDGSIEQVEDEVA